MQSYYNREPRKYALNTHLLTLVVNDFLSFVSIKKN